MRPAKTERFLRCHFTDPELLAISKSMSQAVATRAQTENDKKRMAKEFDALGIRDQAGVRGESIE